MQSVQLSTTAYVHAGFGYDYSAAGTIAGSASLVFIGYTGAKPVHLHSFEVSVDKGPVLIELFETPTVSVIGTEALPRRRNRIVKDPSDMRIYGGGTISAGTLLATRKIHLVGGGAHTEGGAEGLSGEWILEPNSHYAFKISNIDTALCNYSASFFYYEIAL